MLKKVEPVARIFWCFVTFLAATILKLAVLDVLGLIAVPINIIAGRGVLWLWWNDEDGYDPLWWYQEHVMWPKWWREFVWAAIRNRTDNLQFTRFCPPPIPGQVRFIRLANGGQVCWQGSRHYVWTPLPSWLPWEAVSFGWQYHPEDNNGVTGARLKGCGFGGRLTPKVA